VWIKRRRQSGRQERRNGADEDRHVAIVITRVAPATMAAPIGTPYRMPPSTHDLR